MASNNLECQTLNGSKLLEMLWDRIRKIRSLPDSKAMAIMGDDFQIGENPKSPYRCYYCKNTILKRKQHRDHIVPRCRNGVDDGFNLALTCPKCNQTKSGTESISWFWKITDGIENISLALAIDMIARLLIGLHYALEKKIASNDGKYLTGQWIKDPFGMSTPVFEVQADHSRPIIVQWNSMLFKQICPACGTPRGIETRCTDGYLVLIPKCNGCKEYKPNGRK